MEINNLDASLFRESSKGVLNQLLHSCVDEICGYPGPTYQQFANNLNWTESDFARAYRLFSTILAAPGALYLDADKMPQEYHDLPEQVRNGVRTCLRVRREQLTHASIMAHSMEHAPTMADFDWRLKMVMGSSKVASLREPLLQLDIVVEKRSEKRVVSLELSREEVDALIRAVESIGPPSIEEKLVHRFDDIQRNE